MYINNINILYYLFLGIIGLGIGQFVAWSTVRLPDYKKVFVREFFTIYLKNEKPKYIYMVAMALLYVGVLYLYGFQIKTLAYLALIPMLISALAIDYRLKIIPNRLNLTIFEVGLVYTFVEGIVNINIAIDMLLGMVAGAGIFLFITLVGGLIAGKEAMGFGDVKLMGALGLFFGWRTIIIISLIAFLLGAIIGVALIICKRKTGDEYIPFGPFIVIATIIAIFVPALYIMVTTHNHDFISLDILLSLKAQRESVPFSALTEALFMMLCFEILRESDVRMSATSGSAISILGGLILGDAAVSAGIISPIMIIVIAISAISGLTFTSIELVSAIRWWRLIMMILAAAFGVTGIIIGTIALFMPNIGINTKLWSLKYTPKTATAVGVNTISILFMA